MPRLEEFLQLLENDIGDVLMGDVGVPIGIQVEFQRLQFNDFLVGDVGNENCGEVRIS